MLGRGTRQLVLSNLSVDSALLEVTRCETGTPPMRAPPQEFGASPQHFARANSAFEEALQTLQTEGVLVGGPAAVMRARELLSPLSGRPSATTAFLEENKAAAAAMAAHTQNHTALSEAVEVATKAAARAAAKSDGIHVLPKVVDRAFVASMGRPSVVTGGTEVDKLDPRNHRQPPALSNCHSGRRQPSPEEHLIAVAISGQLRTFTIEFVWRNIFSTMVQPIQHHANVFMALDSWSKDMGPFVNINGTRRVVEVDLLPNHTLPKALFQLFKPVAVEWGHAGTPATCEGDGHRCLFDFNPSDNKCFGLGDARMGQAYHFWRVSRLIRFHEQACGVHHDWVLRLRPDTVFARRLPPIRFWPPQVLRRPPPPTLFAQDLTAVGFTAVSDTWALMTRDVAKGKITWWTRTRSRRAPNGPSPSSGDTTCTTTRKGSSATPCAPSCQLKWTYAAPIATRNIQRRCSSISPAPRLAQRPTLDNLPFTSSGAGP